jgi:hypothetical protein
MMEFAFHLARGSRDMDRTTFRHRLAVSFLDELRLDVFVRSDHGNVEHYWTDDTDISIFGPEDLGGSFDTDPVAVGNHLIGRSGNRIVDWVWDAHGEPRMLGAPREVVLPGLCASTPEVIGTSGRIDVFAPSLDGPMRHWFRFSGEGWQGPEVLTDDLADVFSQPCAVSRAPGTFDVFSVGAPNQGLLHWFNDAQGWHCERRTRGAAGEGLAGQPAAVWSTDQRLDVFAMRSDGIPMHWGFDGRDWFPDEVKLGDARLDLPVDLTLISIKPRQLTLLARESGGRGDGELRAWSLDPRPPGRWHSSGLEGNLRPTAVWARNSAVQVPPDGAMEERGLMTTLSRDVDRNTRDESDLDSGGGFLRVQHVLTDQHSIDGTEIWETDTASTLALEEPAPPATPLTPADVQPDLLARRPEDLVLLGVRWNEQVEVLAGSPTELLAHAGAKLTVTLPPQHYAEGVVDAAAPSVTGMPGGDVRVSPVRASGPSRVVVSLDEGTRVPLTVDGVLDALRRGRLIPSTKLTDEDTQLELPYRLLVTPFRPDGQPIRLDHPSRPVVGGSGAVALWSTTVAAEGSEPAAGLTLRPLGVDSSDPFRTSLSGASRSRIMAAEPTASIDLLRLSSLGGWLTASGRWESFEWDHEAALGRDVRVRTATMGVLYPWGHRAVYVETSERHLASSAAGATAHLRKRSFLTVTEPVHDLAPSRAFPFTRARVQETVFDFATEPTWTKKPFPPPAADEVRQTRAFLVSVADGLLATIHGGDGFTPGEPVAEDLAFFGGLTDEATAQAAGRYVDAGVAIMRADDTLAALEFGGTAPVPIFFVPGGEATARKVPTVLGGPSGEVAVELPVVFFADVRMPAGLTHPAYRSFDDPVMLEEVDAAWRRTGDGDVAITPVSIDMVGAVVRQPADSPEVRRLHIVGEAMNGGFAPRLGAPAAKPAADRWAFEMAMTEVATLVGQPVSSGPPS